MYTDKKNICMLLVEDDPGDVFLMEEIVEECSDTNFAFEIIEAENIAKAVSNLSAGKKIDLVVMDLGLPDSKGIGTVTMLLPYTKNIPIIVLTGLQDESVAVQAVKAGAQDYLIKGQIDSQLFRRAVVYGMERKKTEEQLKCRNREMAALLSISTSISSSIEMEFLFEEVLKNIENLDLLDDKNKASIFLMKDGMFATGDVYGQAGDSPFSESLKRLFDRQFCSLNGLSKEQLKPLVCLNSDTSSDVECYPNHVGIPFVAKNKILGVMCLYLPPGDEINPQTMEVLLSLGNQLGMAVENAQLYEKTKRLALHDPLTKLANRRQMENFLNYQIKRSERYGDDLCVVMADIDHFKKYNDTFGHTAGDVLLKKTADIIMEEIRESDLAVRYGGEEFMVILTKAQIGQAKEVAERIRKHIEAKLEITISMGIASYQKGMDELRIISIADQALYRAKELGRNRVVVSSSQ
jgi:diguanylate cyclase (GGDEF)-like protein